MATQERKINFIGKLHSKERTLVMYVFQYFLRTMNVSKAVIETHKATGCSKSLVYRLRKEQMMGPFRTPAKRKTKRAGRQRNARSKTYDSFVQTGVRRIVHSLLFDNVPPSLHIILSKVNADETLPTFSRSTLRRFLHDIGFQYVRRGKHSAFIERDDIIRWRHQYLKDIKRIREQGVSIIYTDESWINVGHTTTKEWKDTTVKSARQAAIEGVSSGLRPPSGRGPRFALVHAGGEQGFLENVEYSFLCKKNTADVHDEMDGDNYEKWFSELLLPNCPEGAYIVMDNASYHCRKLEHIPNTSWRKAAIADWLTEKNIEFDSGMLKRELLFNVSLHKSRFEKYVVDEMARASGRHVIRLPPYHCELNPIEMVWAQVKNYIKMNNATFKAQNTKGLIANAYDRVSPANWKNYVEHVKKVERDLWRADELQDDEEFIIHLSSNSSKSSNSSSEYDEPVDRNKPGTSHGGSFLEGFTPLLQDSDSS